MSFFCARQVSCPLIHASDILSDGNRSVQRDGPAQSHATDLTPFHMPASSSPPFPPLQLQHDSVDKGSHLMQLQQKVVHEVKCGEANPHCNGPFNPVHTQAFVQSTSDSFLSYDLAHGPQNCDARRAGNPSCLHAPAHHIQRVRSRLSDQARAGAKGQALVGVRLRSLCLFYRETDGSKKDKINVWVMFLNRLNSPHFYLTGAKSDIKRKEKKWRTCM